MTSRFVVLAIAACHMPGVANQPLQCTGGARLVAGACYCANGMTWNALSCQGTPDATGCSGGGYPFGPPGVQQCYCLDGYSVANGQCVALQCSGGSVAQIDHCACPGNTQWDGAQCVEAQITCNGGAVPSGDQCVCPDGTQWDGAQCVQPAPQITCNGGAVPSGDQCVCPDGTQWDGAQCATVVVQAAPAPRTDCRAMVIDKGYPPSAATSCKAVNARCAAALLDKGYPPSSLTNCVGVDGACAEAVFRNGFPPSSLDSCRRR